MTISVSALIIGIIGLLYLGYVIGAVHCAITSQKEVSRYKNEVEELQKLLADFIVKIQEYINKEEKNV